MGFWRKKKEKTDLNWNEIQTLEELKKAYHSTEEKAALFFKHSTRCGISKMVLNRFESEWENDENYTLYFIDLLAHRNVSDTLSEWSGVKHQSPQVIVIKNEAVVYDASHNGIKASIIKK